MRLSLRLANGQKECNEKEMTRVGVIGARGKVGAAICEAVAAAPDLELVGKVGRNEPLQSLLESGAQVPAVLRPSALSDSLGNLMPSSSTYANAAAPLTASALLA